MYYVVTATAATECVYSTYNTQNSFFHFNSSIYKLCPPPHSCGRTNNVRSSHRCGARI